jgi:hypothetical protein
MDYIQYHKPKSGNWRATRKAFGIRTDKKLAWRLGGQTVWLVQGVKVRGEQHYYLRETFIVDRIQEHGPDWTARFAISGHGHGMKVEIGQRPWFRKLLQRTANFSIGLTRISNRAILRGLRQARDVRP